MGARLNLGCGRLVRPGWVNADAVPGPGVDVLIQGTKLPFSDESFDEVLMSHSLEHVPDVGATLREVHRILRPRGRLTVIVPYGLRSLLNPLHHHAFDEHSMDLFTKRDEKSLEQEPLFEKFRVAITSRGFPWWHVRKYTGLELPIGIKEEVTFWLLRRS